MTTEQFLNLLILAASAVTAIAALPTVVAPLLRLLRGRATAQDINLLNETASRVVMRIEQTMPRASSEEKLAAAIDKVSTAVSVLGLKVSPETIRDAIEMAVFLLPAGQTVPAVPADLAAPAA